MGLFNRKKPEPAPTPAGPPPGAISLTKGQGISLTKTSLITVTCSWPPSTDYDVYALVTYRDGRVETVSTFGTKEPGPAPMRATSDGAVTHLGDVRRSGAAQASETIEVRLTPDIDLVVPVVYSAQSNGTGSFRRFRVNMSIDNGAGQSVFIDASNASADDTVYSCVPGTIRNGAELRIEALEAYSAPGSERRPVVQGGAVVMDQGPENAYK